MRAPAPLPTAYGQAAKLVGAATSVRVASTAITSLAGLASIVLAVRLLGPASYGTLAFALSLVGVATGLSRLGLGPATVRSVAASGEGETESVTLVVRGVVTILTVAALLASAAIGIVLLGQGVPAQSSDRFWLIGGLAFFVFGRTLSMANFWTALGMGRVGLMETGNMAMSLVLAVQLLILTLLDQSQLRAVAACYGIAGGIGVAVALLSLRRVTAHLSRALRVSAKAGLHLLRISAPYAVAGITIQIIGQFDVLVLGLTGTTEEVGRYEPALRLTERLLTLVPFLFTTGFVPAATRLFSNQKSDEFRALYRTVSRFMFALAALGLILLAGFPAVSLDALFGSGFTGQRDVVWILLLGYGANLVFGLNGGALAATGHRRAIATAYAVALVVMVATAGGLIPTLGPRGAALATSSSYLCLNVAVSVALFRLTRAHVFDAQTVFVVVSAGAPIGVAVWIGRSVASFPSAIMLAVALWTGWILMLLLARALRWRDVAPFLPWRRTEAT